MTYEKSLISQRFWTMLAGLALIALAGCGESGNDATGAADTNAAPVETAGNAIIPPADAAEVPADIGPRGEILGDIVLGAADAPVEVIEYGSLTCGGCARFHEVVLPELKKKYIETGKVRFVFRHFVRDPADLAASKITRCQGVERYYPLLDLFFARQRNWLNNDYEANLANLSRRAGLGKAKLDACLADQELQDMIIEQRQAGVRDYEVNSTPTIIVNGKPVDNALNFDAIDRAIARQL